MSTRICVVGAGAIGGLLGARLARSGHAVSLIARGAHLQAIQTQGLTLVDADGRRDVVRDVKATDRIGDAGVQDVVMLALKAHQIPPVASELSALFERPTIVVTLQNGIPWWYFQRHGGPLDGQRLESLDPGGTIETHVAPERIIGCIAYPATEIAQPGVIRQVEGNRFPVGEPDGSESERVKWLAALLEEAGFRSRVLTDIRSEIWLKAWGNLCFNPISALTHATLAGICRFPETRALAETMMREAESIAGKLGVRFRHTIERRIAGAESVGEHKTSMLQDLEAGKPMEIEALIGAVLELARLTQASCPAIESVYACVKLLDRTVPQQGKRLRPESAR
ncbi:MAG: 2-dehydropantoate 2-reductase [Gammaproteobacteria bacterium]|nr:2-dehydropantoate 2-reductase [Gammaproteobacteria bacterium]NIR83323.1 2-dehydropantoate 2-reductase [Gammaproteobacteria bacterium]NIR91123.1 2-dehydropantoate 2-reductase [Gammaproteobacteria bacterium]NIU04490.1 2-dehydropantoate 2-reductase [Gammaproteobacteria bacterium]NIW87126.1 2-dehydropantoate 2-reductase [Gammaproteobacteria bacterium]